MAHILVVDDDVEIRRLVGRMLQIKGSEVDLAENGAVALDILGDTEVDLVVSDICMPIMDGHVLLSKMRAQGHMQPFIFMSGHKTADSQDVLGADAFIGKPFTFADLINVVDGVLHRVPV